MHVGGGIAVFQLQNFRLRTALPGFKIKSRQAKCGRVCKWAFGALIIHHRYGNSHFKVRLSAEFKRHDEEERLLRRSYRPNLPPKWARQLSRAPWPVHVWPSYFMENEICSAPLQVVWQALPVTASGVKNICFPTRCFTGTRLAMYVRQCLYSVHVLPVS